MNELITDIPNAPKVNHRKLGWKEKFDLCAHWKESGLCKSKFCMEHKIPIPVPLQKRKVYSTVNKKARKQNEIETASRF